MVVTLLLFVTGVLDTVAYSSQFGFVGMAVGKNLAVGLIWW